MKRILLVLAALGLVLVLAIGVVTACVVRSGHGLRFGFGLDQKASRTEQHTLDLKGGQLLAVELPAGRIRVKASPEVEPSLSAVLTAYGGSQEEANKHLAAAKLEITTSADGVRIRLASEEREETLFGGFRRGNTASADLEIRAPSSVRLDLSSRSGDVDAEGPFASSKVHSSYGSVRIQGVEGDLEATSSSGDVRARAVRGKALAAKTKYGKVEITDCDSTKIEANSRSGDVLVEGAKLDLLEAGSGYGDVELKHVAGEIAAELSSGDVRLQDWKGSRARLTTGYGDVRVDRAEGAVEAASRSGDVEIRDLAGALEAKSSYGSLRLDGVFSGLGAETRSGDIRARARTGSRVNERWTLSSAYGGVELLVPEGFGCDLEAKTAYGSVAVDLPIEIRPGTQTRKRTQSIEGKVNGGGGRVLLDCRSGDVKVAAAGSDPKR